MEAESVLWERDRENGRRQRVRLASYFAGSAVASSLGLYLLQRDYKIAYDSISQKMGGLHDSMESRISALEKLNQNDGSQHVQAAE